MSDVRVWLYTSNDEKKGELGKTILSVSRGFLDNQQEDNEEVEHNSGVEFPGQSLEPLLNSALRVNQL